MGEGRKKRRLQVIARVGKLPYRTLSITVGLMNLEWFKKGRGHQSCIFEAELRHV